MEYEYWHAIFPGHETVDIPSTAIGVTVSTFGDPADDGHVGVRALVPTCDADVTYATDHDRDDGIWLSDAETHTNVFVGDSLVGLYDKADGEFAIYDPATDSEDPEYIVDVAGHTDE